MVYADLHVHTTTSDGILTPSTLPDAAHDANVSVVGVTDHDRIAAGLTAPIQHLEALTVIRGIELRVDPGDDQERVDLLGYAVEPTSALRTELNRLQDDRMERGAAIRDLLEAHLDVDIEIAIKPGIGRPHLAKAVVDHPDTQYTSTDAVFQELIGTNGPCFVPRKVTSYTKGRQLLADACAVVGLAHPLRYDDPEAALSLTAELDAVERYYPYDDAVDVSIVDAAIETHDLIPTGGSDAHDTELGRAGLAEPEYDELRRRLPDA